ncbi:MAG TPA: TonB-dependent receptor, partial [Steroidobacteraceae bacterium]|nr:TonB-dependent receptor [Steroidobacteraceae bacterium]
EGGVVRFITPTPSLTTNSVYARAETSFTAHGDPSFEAGSAFGGPIKDDVLGIRLNGWYRHTGGWVDRTSWQTGQTADNANWSEAWGGRVAMLWAVTDSVRATASVLYQGSHNNDTPNYWSLATGSGVDAPPTCRQSDPGAGHFNNCYASRQPSTEDYVLPSLKVEADIGALRLTSVTSFFYRKETNVSDVTNYDIAGALGATGANLENNIFPTVPGGAPVLDQFIGATNQNVFTQELRLQSNDANAKVRWVGGLYFQNSRLSDSQHAPNPQLENLFLAQQGAGAFDAYYYTSDCVSHCSGLLNGIYEYVGREDSSDWQLAAFGNVDWSITDRLILNAGLRVERTKSKFVAKEDGPVNNGTSEGGGESNGTPVTPKVGLSFQQDNDTLYYASVAKGYREGGGNSHVPPSCSLDLGNIGLSNPPKKYDPDYTYSYELGTKQKAMDGRMAVSASVYYIDWRNIQWYYFYPSCGYGDVFNLGRAQSTGFDLQFDARVTENLLASLAVGYNDAKFKNTVSLGGAPVVFSGQTLGQAPWTVFGSLEYGFALGAQEGYYARLTDSFRSANTGPYLYQFSNSAVADPDLHPGPSINQLDLRLGRKWHGVDLSLFVNNALDAAPRIVNPQASHYVGYDFATGNSVSSSIFSYSSLQPRTIGITATLNL